MPSSAHRLRNVMLAAALTAPAAPAAAAPDGAAIGRAAACAISADRRDSRRLAAAIPGSEEERSAWTAIGRALDRCLRREGVADDWETRQLFAGRVAERLYVASTSVFESRVVSTTTTTAGAMSLPQAISNRTSGWPPEAALAECVVAAAANEVDRLLRTDAGSAEEARAMEPIAAALPGCLVQGRQLAISRARLRAELGRAFYRYIFVTIMGTIRPVGGT